MKKTIILLPILLVISTFTSSVDSKYYSKTLPCSTLKEQTTHLHFYMHDTLSGKNPTAIEIASPNLTRSKNNPISFGALFAIDDPLTEGPELSSKLIGNARGMYLSASKDKIPALVLYLDLGFTSGEFKGSSISVFSRNPIMETSRELAVVGGRGRFRMARGFVEVHSYFLDGTSGDAILEYNVTVVHP